MMQNSIILLQNGGIWIQNVANPGRNQNPSEIICHVAVEEDMTCLVAASQQGYHGEGCLVSVTKTNIFFKADISDLQCDKSKQIVHGMSDSNIRPIRGN